MASQGMIFIMLQLPALMTLVIEYPLHFALVWTSMENLPNGLIEHLRSDEEKKIVIISETDLKGIILSANDPFCTISGYCREELIGRPHDIIRHPDMPKELFSQLWTTIERGAVFRGIIKNRTREGGHYWVNATIMPVFHDGKIERYVAGRYLVNDDLVAAELFRKQMASFPNRY